MKRRTFLQMGGMTAASALLAGCQSKNEKLIPFLIPPDEGVTPGRANYYASSCNFCPAGCGILVRVSEGRAKKVEGNPEHPVNRGRLCARGQAILQELYHPDRVQHPLRRNGPRGSGEFTKISWGEGLKLLTTKLLELQRNQAGDSLAMLIPHMSGSLYALLTTFMSSFGSPHLICHELLATDWLSQASRESFGQPNLPYYDLAETHYLLSFGADFVESHLSPVQHGNAFGRMRQGRDTIRGHFTYVGGRMSLTGASADRWMPARPASEGALALGMARLILDESRFDRAALATNGIRPQELLASLEAYHLPQVAELTGLTQESIAEVAREFAGTRPSLALAGETIAFQTNGQESVRAVQLLNLLTGSLNRPGGVYPAAAMTGPENSHAELLALIKRMHSGQVRLAMIKGDPCHTVPPASGFQQALDKVPFIVSFSPLIDDTAQQADLILPDHAALESWGDVVPRAGSRHTIYGLMQPVVTPLHDTRQFGDVLLATAAELGGKVAAALPWKSSLEMLKATVSKRSGLGKGEDFEARWVELLRQGGHFDSNKALGKGYHWSSAATVPNPVRPSFAGELQQFPLHLQVYASVAFHDGRGALFPWLQQLPDPMSTVVWGSWLEINPATAKGLGINHGDLVEVTSPQGKLRLPAVIYPGIRPDMVAIPLGQGHRAGGRYSTGRGVNPLALLALVEGSELQPAWNATMVRVNRISDKGELVTAGHPEGSYRSDLVGI